MNALELRSHTTTSAAPASVRLRLRTTGPASTHRIHWSAVSVKKNSRVTKYAAETISIQSGWVYA